jgi:hypothetical protein
MVGLSLQFPKEQSEYYIIHSSQLEHIVGCHAESRSPLMALCRVWVTFYCFAAILSSFPPLGLEVPKEKQESPSHLPRLL